MSKRILVANWKMNVNTETIQDLSKKYLNRFGHHDEVEIIICPPYPYIDGVKNIIQGSRIKLGAQNAAEHERGSYTGEVSSGMLHDIGCKYVIIGHSERRKYYNETDEVIARKIASAIEASLIPILCVGEELSIRREGAYLKIIREQIEKSRILIQKSAIIAYEPVWAIGTGTIPKMEEIAEVAEMIKGLSRFPLLYGGSVSCDNSTALSAIKKLDGFLVGAASLKSEEFNLIHQSLLNPNIA